MDKAYEINTRAIINSALVSHGEINAVGIGLDTDKFVVNKTEWQIGIEQQLQALAAENAALPAQVNALHAALAVQAEACNQRR